MYQPPKVIVTIEVEDVNGFGAMSLTCAGSFETGEIIPVVIATTAARAAALVSFKLQHELP